MNIKELYDWCAWNVKHGAGDMEIEAYGEETWFSLNFIENMDGHVTLHITKTAAVADGLTMFPASEIKESQE